MTSGTTRTLNAVWGSSGSDVFAVGEGGTTLHYPAKPGGGGDVSTTIVPASGGTLVFSDMSGSIPIGTTIQVPTNAVTDTITLVYNELAGCSQPAPAGFGCAGRSFTVEAYQGYTLQPDYGFKIPVTVIITYNPGTLGGEDSLELYYWDENTNSWSNDGIVVVAWDKANRQLVVTINHLSDFALIGDPHTGYLPIILRN